VSPDGAEPAGMWSGVVYYSFRMDILIESYPFTLSLNFPEHLKVTTLLGLSIISSPVAGFLPLRSRFSLTHNLPNPLIRTSSPDARVDLIISRIVSTVSEDCFLVNPLASAMASIKLDFVRVMGLLWLT